MAAKAGVWVVTEKMNRNCVAWLISVLVGVQGKEFILMQLNFDYYYGDETDQYSFYRIPKVLLSDVRFRKVSLDAKVLYEFLLETHGVFRRKRLAG